MRRLFYFLCLLLGIYGLAQFCREQTGGFTFTSLSSNHPFSLPTLGEKERALQILDQPFTYLGKGGEAVVFASRDGHYVLKFFHRHPHPFVFRHKYRARKYQQLKQTFQGYTLAFQRIFEESGLIFIHFNHTPFTSQKVSLTDNIGIVHSVDLNQLEFALQKRAEPLPSYLSQHPGQKEAILQGVSQLLAQLAQRGIYDGDLPHLYRNVGWLEGRPILFDPGRCFEGPPQGNLELPGKFLSRVQAHPSQQ